MAISAIFFLDIKGRIIIFRDYRGDVSPKYAEKFMSKINEMEEAGKLSPVIYDEGVTYLYLQVANLYILAVTRTNVNACSTLVFLHRLVDVFKHYFQELEEESLRDNFVIVYELLDEVCMLQAYALTSGAALRAMGPCHGARTGRPLGHARWGLT